MLRVFIGYDRRETVAFHTAAWSLMRRSSIPVSITGLMLPQLPQLTREPEGSTEFSFSRFLVPHLCDYQGHALFMDCDVLVRADVAELLKVDAVEMDKPVRVVKHDYVPRDTVKFLGNKQQSYARKNWSSVMLFRCASCRMLTPDYVNRATGLQLHQFRWLQDREIGALDPSWNWLIGEYPPNPDAKIVHFTRGGPWFPEYRDCEFADEWRAERAEMLRAG